MTNSESRLRQWLFPIDWSERIQAWIVVILQVALIGVMWGALYEQRWLLAFTSIIVLTLTLMPALIERELHVRLPIEFTLINCLFLYAAFVLGEVRAYYLRFWWWDLMLHSFSAVVMGLIGFLLVYIFYRTKRITITPSYVAAISFGTAVTVGTLWEIFEYLMDLGFGFTMQKSGLADTMSDLIVNALGALLAAWFGYLYVKGGDSLIADRLVKRFVAKNPRLFDRKRQPDVGQE